MNRFLEKGAAELRLGRKVPRDNGLIHNSLRPVFWYFETLSGQTNPLLPSGFPGAFILRTHVSQRLLTWELVGSQGESRLCRKWEGDTAIE